MTVTSDHPTTVGVSRRPLRRQSANAVLGGVCAGLALRLGLRETLVRIGFVLLAAVFGLGLIVYMLMWLGTPRVGEDQSIGLRLANKKREAEAFLLSVAVVIILLIGLYSLDLRATGAYAWSVLLSALGVGAIWRGASRTSAVSCPRSSATRRSRGPDRRGGGAPSCCASSRGSPWASSGSRSSGRSGGPGGRSSPSSSDRRRSSSASSSSSRRGGSRRRGPSPANGAIASARRSAPTIAAHLHDSVLQTLTLIQNVASNDDEVVRLARDQERELRQWLFDPRRPHRGRREHAARRSRARSNATSRQPTACAWNSSSSATAPSTTTCVALVGRRPGGGRQRGEVVGGRRGVDLRRGRGPPGHDVRARHRRGL